MPSLRRYMAIVYLLIAALMLGAALLPYFSSKKVEKQLHSTIQTLLIKNSLIREFRDNMQQIQIATEHYIEDANEQSRQKLAYQIHERAQTNYNFINRLDSLASNPDERTLVKTVADLRKTLAIQRDEVIRITQTNDKDSAMAYFLQKETPVYDDFFAATQTLLNYNKQQTHQQETEIYHLISKTQTLINILLLIVFVVTLLAGYISYRSNKRLQTQNKELHQNEVRFRQLLSGVPDAMVGADTTGKIIYANHHAEQLFGYTQKEFMGAAIELLMPQKYRTKHEQQQQHHHQQNHNRKLGEGGKEFFGLRKDNTIFPCEIALSKIETPQGIMILSTIRDLTERKKQLQKITQLSQAVEQSTSTIVITDTNGNIEYVNPKFTEATGYTAEEVMGKNPRILKSGYTSSDEYLKMWQNITTGKEWKGELYNKKKNGEFYWESATISPVVNAKGEIVNFMAVKEDITQRKQDQAELLAREQKLREAQRIAKVGSWEWNLETGKLHFSEEMLNIFGIHDKESVQSIEQLFDYVHPNDKARLMENISIAEKDRKTKERNSYRIITPAGETKHVETRGSQESNTKDEVIILRGTIQDVTEMVNLENENRNIHRKTMLTLEAKVAERTTEINIQKEIIEQKNKDLTDSIVYALRLQKALYTDMNILHTAFPNSYILNQPCQIVSGDFCWFYKKQNKVIIATVDCTGHGVPGAFMSIIGMEMLNRIITDQGMSYPTVILEMMDIELEKLLTHNNSETVKDGMDASICIIDSKAKKIEFAGAHHPIVMVSGGVAALHKANRYGLGKYLETGKKQFDTHVINYNPGDRLYMFSDGYRDQFGGAKNKKLGLTKFVSQLEEIAQLPVNNQKVELTQRLNAWKNEQDQVDDIMIVGVEL